MAITSDTMDESTFKTLSHEVIERVRRSLDVQDPDVVEAVLEAEVLKIVFANGKGAGNAPFVLNTQRPTREVWLAADRHAWHFRFDGDKWVDKKGTGAELFTTLADLVSKRAGTAIGL